MTEAPDVPALLDPDTAADTADAIVTALPWLPLLIGALMLAAGVTLVISGRRTLRPAAALAGLVVGGACGWILAEATAMAPGWIGAAVGAALLCALCILLFRLAVAGALGLALAFMAGALVLALDTSDAHGPPRAVDAAPPERPGPQHTGDDAPGPAAPDPGSWLDERPAESGAAPARDPEPGLAERLGGLLRDEARDAARQRVVDEFERHGGDMARVDAFTAWAAARWADLRARILRLDPAGRRTLLAALTGGLLAGLLLGAFCADVAAIIASAAVGSALVIAGLRITLVPLSLEPAAASLDRAEILLGAWALFAAAGSVVQWTNRGRRADRSR